MQMREILFVSLKCMLLQSSAPPFFFFLNACYMDGLQSLEVRWQRKEKKVFGRGISIHQLSWHGDGELAWKQETA